MCATRGAIAVLGPRRFFKLHSDIRVLYPWIGVYLRRVEPASPRENHGDVSWVVSTPRSPAPAPLHLLALQLKAKPVLFESAEASALHTPTPFGFNPGDARDRGLIEFDRRVPHL